MPLAPTPDNEQQRIAALHSLGILDTGYEERFDRITRLARRLFEANTASVTLIDEDRQWFKSKEGPLAAQTPLDESICAWTILEPSSALVIEDTHADPRMADNPAVTAEDGVRFYAGYPIAAPSGETIGTICISDDKPRAALSIDIEALRDLAEMVESEIASVSLAIGDELTGISNRRGFELLGSRLYDIALRLSLPVMVLYADLDNLKPLNDRLGHEAGDAALRETAALLQRTLRESDVLARVGGDEFCALLAGVHASEAAATIERIETAIADRNSSADGPELSISIGSALGTPAIEDRPLAQLVDEADAAMLAAKRQRKGDAAR